MTPKEKAKELVDKFDKSMEWIDTHHSLDKAAKDGALIVVDEILAVQKEMPATISTRFYIQYWQQVKEYILKSFTPS